MYHFKTNSFPMQVSRVSCDAEIGSYKRGWHVCNAKAIVQAESRVCEALYLHYCARHSKRAAAMRNHTTIAR